MSVAVLFYLSCGPTHAYAVLWVLGVLTTLFPVTATRSTQGKRLTLNIIVWLISYQLSPYAEDFLEQSFSPLPPIRHRLGAIAHSHSVCVCQNVVRHYRQSQR